MVQLSVCPMSTATATATATCHRFFLLIIALVLVQIDLVSGTICYTPNGTVSNDVPCNASAEASVCCTQGFLCTSNGLCQPKDWWDGTSGDSLQFIRGTCTDRTWASPECPGRCVAESVGGGEWVMRCGANSNNYCCSADDCCSKPSYLKFTLDNPSITATAGVEKKAMSTSSASSSSSTAAEATTSTTSMSSTSSSSPVSISISTSSESESAPVSTGFSSPPSTKTAVSTYSSLASTETSTSLTSSPSSANPPRHSNDTSIIIGVAVGCGAGILLVACLVFFVFFRIRKKSKGMDGPLQNYPGDISSVQQKRPIDGALRSQQPWELESPYHVAELDGRYTTRSEAQ